MDPDLPEPAAIGLAVAARTMWNRFQTYRPRRAAVKARCVELRTGGRGENRAPRHHFEGRQPRRARARPSSPSRALSSSRAPTRPDSRSGWRTVVRPMAAASSMSSKPIDREVAGHGEAGARGRVEHAEGLHVGGREDGGRRAAQRQQLARQLHGGLAAERAAPDVARRQRHAGLAQGARASPPGAAGWRRRRTGCPRRRRRRRCADGRPRADGARPSRRRRRRRWPRSGSSACGDVDEHRRQPRRGAARGPRPASAAAR